MSLITLSGVASTSAPTKAQKEAAIYLFGSKGHSIVSVLDKFARAKEIRAPHLNGLLKLLKDAEDEEIIKFAASAAGKKTVANAKVFATAKTLTASIKALRLIRVPQKWIEGHSDAAAARIQETKEIRARKTAGNKPEKPIKLDNPHAPEAVDASPAALYDNAIAAKAHGPFEEVHEAVKKAVKQFGLKTRLEVGKAGESTIAIIKGRNIDGRIAFPSKKRKLGWAHDDPNQFFLTAINDEERDEVMDYVSATGKNAAAKIAKAFVALWEKSAAGEFGDIPVKRVAGAKTSKTKAAAYTPTNKSDVTLVDELAEVTARKISAKPLQAREEYFNALRNVLQKNLPKAIVSTISNGVTVTTKRDFIIALEDNAWTLKIGITGKPKKIGATFDIVDLLGMIDKSILRPKSGVGTKRPEPPYFERIKKNAAGEYTTQIQANENVAYAAHFKREGDTFVFSTPVYSDVQRFITQGMSETGIKWETFTGRSVTFSKTDADKFEKWVKSIKRSQPLTSNKTFPAIAPKPRGGGMSM